MTVDEERDGTTADVVRDGTTADVVRDGTTADKMSLFDQLDPPPGGLERMRRRFEQQRVPSTRPRRRWQTATAVGIVASGVAVSLLVRDRRAPEPERGASLGAGLYAASEFDRLLGRRLETVELRVAINDESRVISEVESSRPQVRIYELELSEP